MRKLFFVAIAAVFFPLCLVAQSTVKGFLYDKDNGEPVPFANVILENTTYGSATDINGFFLINKIPAGEYNLLVKYIGYEEHSEKVVIKTAGQTVQLHIELKPSVKTLSTVKVSGRKQERRDNTKVSVEKISPMEIQQMPSIGGQADIAQYLQVLPGINFTGDQGGQLYIRGGSMIQNKSLLDGMVVYNPFHSIGLFSVFETDVILNADVYTGGFGAEYGGRISSVIDITTRDGNSKRHTGKISANTMGAGILVEGPLKRERPDSKSAITYLITAKNSYLSHSSKLLYPYIEGGLPYDFLDVYGKLSFKAESGSKLSVFGFGYNDWVSNYQAIADYNWANYGAGTNFVIVPGSDALVEGTIAYSDYKISFSDVQNTGMAPRTSEIGGLSALLDIVNFFGKDKLTYGINVEMFRTDYSFQNQYSRKFAVTENTSELAVFATYKMNRDRWILEPGLRLVYYASVAEFYPEPRLAVKYKIGENLRLKLAAGLYSQNFLDARPDNDVVNLFNGFLTGSENLGITETFRGEEVNSCVQNAQHLIFGVEYDATDWLSFNVEPYFKNFSQLVNMNRNLMYDNSAEYQEGGMYEKPEYLRKDFIIEQGKAYGVDISARSTYGMSYLWVAYSLGFVERSDELVTYNPHYDRRHNLNVLFTYKAGQKLDWEFSLRWNYGSGFPYTQTLGLYENLTLGGGLNADYRIENGETGIYYATVNGGRLPSYHRLDASVKKRFSFGKRSILDISLSVTNLYNRSNMFYFNRLTFERVDQLPIMPSLGMSLTF